MADQKELFEQLEAAFPGGEHSTWFIYAGLVFQANDQMHFIGDLYDFLRSQTNDDHLLLRKIRQLREAQLKASVLIGFPKGINGCMTLRKAVQASSPELSKELDQDSSLRAHLTRSEKDARGKAFFSRIYAQHTDRVLDNMSKASGGDLSEFAINAVYGDLMAEETRMGAKETGLLEFLACYAAGGSTWSQAKGHMYGSHNLGNGKEEIQGAVRICTIIEKHLDIHVNRTPEENWAWLSKSEKW